MAYTVQLPEWQIEQIANKTADIVFNRIKLQTASEMQDSEWCSAQEAAYMLGVSADYMRRIKENFTHKKVGESKKGRVFFKRATLMDEYLNMVRVPSNNC